MSQRLMTGFLTVWPVATTLLLSSCGGDETCQQCDLAGNGFEVCPEITKQCSFGTITARQCEGEANSSAGCCATSPGQISCGNIAAGSNGHYKMVNNVIRLEVTNDRCRTEARIDPVVNGWISVDMSDVEKERVIGDRMAQLYAMRETR